MYSISKKKFWLVAADMGYGHQRAIYPLRFLAEEETILNANTSPYSTTGERRLWKEMVYLYEFISRAGQLPVIGRLFSALLDTLLYIPQFYPKRDNSNSTLQVKYLKSYIRKGLCSGILEQTGKLNLPMITSFYASAIAAATTSHQIVYCIICDTDLSRVWVSESPETSKIIYFAPGTIAAHRLHSYGVPEKSILITGFPLPLELIGNRNLDTLINNMRRRLRNLDPEGIFHDLYKHSINAYLGNKENNDFLSLDTGSTLTITYTVGGAGAQKETGRLIANSLAYEIRENRVILNLVAGTRKDLRDYFLNVRKYIDPGNDNVRIIWENDTESYFDSFNKCLCNTDILWTKPSELSFYCALGIPIIMTPAIGPQEKCNKNWLREIGAGIKQKNPEDSNQWLFDMIKNGRLGEAAWNGFLKARKYGTYNIMDFLENGSFKSSNDPLKR